jgi:hypothetical protein
MTTTPKTRPIILCPEHKWDENPLAFAARIGRGMT